MLLAELVKVHLRKFRLWHFNFIFKMKNKFKIQKIKKTNKIQAPHIGNQLSGFKSFIKFYLALLI